MTEVKGLRSDLKVGPGYASALAVRSPEPPDVRTFRF